MIKPVYAPSPSRERVLISDAFSPEDRVAEAKEHLAKVQLTQPGSEPVFGHYVYDAQTNSQVFTPYPDCEYEKLGGPIYGWNKINPLDQTKYPLDQFGLASLLYDWCEFEERRPVYWVKDISRFAIYSSTKGKFELTETSNIDPVLIRTFYEALLYAQTCIDDPSTQKAFYKEYILKLKHPNVFRTFSQFLTTVESNIREWSVFENPNPYYFNLANGTLDIRTGKRHDHTPDDMLIACSDTIYEPKAKCKRLDKFLLEIMENNQEKLNFMLKILSYCLLNENPLEQALLLYGPSTRNGKGTLCDALLGMLGDDYGHVYDFSAISNRNIANNEQLAHLNGKRLAVCQEIGVDSINSELAKQLVSRGKLSASRKYEHTFHFLNRALHIWQSNNIPDFSDYSFFSSDRLIVIEFTHRFPAEKQDTTLKQQFATPDAKSALLNILLKAWAELSKDESINDITPQCVKDATQKVVLANDPTSRWMHDSFAQTKNPADFIPPRTYYPVYRLWCQERGRNVGTMDRLINELSKHKFFPESSQGTAHQHDIQGYTFKNSSAVLLPNVAAPSNAGMASPQIEQLVTQWLGDCCTHTNDPKGSSLTPTEYKGSFSAWCSAHGHPKISGPQLQQAIRSLDIDLSDTSRGRKSMKGWALNPQTEPVPPLTSSEPPQQSA